MSLANDAISMLAQKSDVVADGPIDAERLMLWQLAVRGGNVWLKDLASAPKPITRKSLIRQKLIDERKDKTFGDHGKSLTRLSLTEAGWAWCEQNLGRDIQKNSKAAAILQLLLGHLKMRLRAQGQSFGQFICQPQDPVSLVKIAVQSQTHNRTDVRVRLSDLRPVVAELTKDQVDDALLQLEQQGYLVLFPIDEPLDVKPADDVAALRTRGGAVRHVLYLRRG